MTEQLAKSAAAHVQDPLDMKTCSSGNNVSSPRRLARISGSYSNLASPRVSTQLNWYRGNSIAPGVGRANLQQVTHAMGVTEPVEVHGSLSAC